MSFESMQYPSPATLSDVSEGAGLRLGTVVLVGSVLSGGSGGNDKAGGVGCEGEQLEEDIVKVTGDLEAERVSNRSGAAGEVLGITTHRSAVLEVHVGGSEIVEGEEGRPPLAVDGIDEATLD
mmetsp:Transcript_21095/g.70269  ORF Transcript_21095/g.70269 Transcript_21095/m.70269 type:complete len:123 (+) Transcript_21095:99-467(+)